METITETPRPRRPFSKARPRKELLAQIQRAQRMREMEGQGQTVQEEHVEIRLAADDPVPPPPPRPRPFSKARPRKELLAQIQRAQEKRQQEQQENIPPVEPCEHFEDNRTTFDKLVDRLDHEGAVAKAPHPRSALEAVLNEEGREYNDSTIASLENIIHPVLDTPPNPRKDEILLTAETDHRPSRHRSEQNEREEELALASLSKQLYATQTTIKDANRGLRRISNKIEGTETSQKENPTLETKDGPANVKIEEPAGTDPKRATTSKSDSLFKRMIGRKSESVPKPKNDPKPEAPVADPAPPAAIAPQVEPSQPIPATSQLNHDGRTICAHCGGRYVSVWRALWVEFRENFYTYDPTSRFYIRMTWLGWIMATFLVWLTIESSLCLTWCDNIDGPLMPFVTHYVVLQPLRPYLKPYWQFLGWVIDTVFNLENGQVSTRGYGRSIPAGTFTAAAATARATRRVVKSAMEAVDEMGSMWDDEFL